MKELQAKAKVTQTMTRDGLVVENQADGTVENVSSREAEQDYSTDAEGKAEKILERAEDVKDKHKAKKKAKQAVETAESEDGLHGSAARLELTEEERADPALQPFIQKAEKKADKLDAARAALPKKRVPVKEKVYDAASGKLDSLANDDSLTDDQKKQVKELQKQLSDAQQQEKQQEESSQKKAEQRDAFSKKMDELESDDLKISSAENQEDELAMTASSFEQWDNLLSEMYDYLATVLNADQYASEEASYKQWVQERDSGAENAAKETEDDTAKQLASYSFKQSYTKTHCYKLLDLMN